MGSDVSARLLEAWTDEVQATVVYGLIASREADPRRAEVLRQLAEIERAHRARLEGRMRELGIAVPDERTVKISAWRRLQARVAPVDRLLARQEAIEQMQMAGAQPDVVVGCVGGGSNFAGLAFPFLAQKFAGTEIKVIAAEPASCLCLRASTTRR